MNVIFDFDGVIHSYSSGWQGVTNIPDPPVDGIRRAIKEIREAGYKVVVVSSRCYQDGGIDAIKDYLGRWNIEVDDVTGEKPPAIVTIDDRAICFDESGQAKTIIVQVKSGGVKRGQIATLKGDMEREGAVIGAFVTLEDPTRPIREEAASAGFYTPDLYPDRQYRRVQILTIEELLDGRELKYQGEPATFRRAKRQRKGPKQPQGRIE